MVWRCAFAITIIGGYAVTFLPYNIWYGLASVGLLATSVYACYVLATAALVSMLNFIVFMLITRKSKTKNQTQRNFNKAMKTAKRHSRIQTAILTSVFIMPTVKRQHGRMQTDRISQNLWVRQSINVRYVAELKRRWESDFPLLFKVSAKPWILSGAFIHAYPCVKTEAG